MQLQPLLKGKHVTLKPLSKAHFADLFLVASDPKVWEQHPRSDRYKEDVFAELFELGLKSEGAFVIVDNITDYIIGSTRFYDFDPVKNHVIIGYTFIATEYWGKGFNREAKHLLLNHAFQFVDTVLFEIGKANIRSQKAIGKIGAKLFNELVVDDSPHLIYKIERADFQKSII